MNKRIIYYQDELKDDFAGTKIKTKPLRENYCYVHTNFFWKLIEFIFYRMIAQPFAFLYTKIVYLHRFKNREVIKQAKGKGAYLYANHSHLEMDVFVPNVVDYSRRCYLVTGPDAMSIPGLNNLVTMGGGIPLADNLRQKGEMVTCIKTRIEEGALVTFYPEAHIWPFYTGIRPFVSGSFVYPAQDGSPVYAITNCYQKRRLLKLPKLVTFIDGPFYADMSLSLAERKEALRMQCYEAMLERVKTHSTYEYVKYVKKDNKSDLGQ